MNLKNNNGYVLTDAAIALIIILILIPTITGMIYNINRIKHGNERKTEAINIAVNTIEVAKSINMADLPKTESQEETTGTGATETGTTGTESTGSETQGDETQPQSYSSDPMIKEIQKQLETETNYEDIDIQGNRINMTYKSNEYRVEITSKDYSEEHTDVEENILKTITVTVTYHVGGEEKSIDLSTVVT